MSALIDLLRFNATEKFKQLSLNSPLSLKVDVEENKVDINRVLKAWRA